jgi:hypothetical protein
MDANLLRILMVALLGLSLNRRARNGNIYLKTNRALRKIARNANVDGDSRAVMHVLGKTFAKPRKLHAAFARTARKT